MTVLCRGDEKVHEVTCRCCGSDLAYNQGDVKSRTVTLERWNIRVEGKPQTKPRSREIMDYIICPICSGKINLPTSDQFFACVVE